MLCAGLIGWGGGAVVPLVPVIQSPLLRLLQVRLPITSRQVLPESESIVLRERLRSPLHPQGHTPVGKLSRHPQATIVFPREAHLGAKSPGGRAHGGEPSLGSHLCPVLRLGCALAGEQAARGWSQGPCRAAHGLLALALLTVPFVLWMLGNLSTYLGTLPIPAIGTVVSNLESKVIFEGVWSAPLASRTNSSQRRGQTN